jgi:HlyD family secretion protein
LNKKVKIAIIVLIILIVSAGGFYGYKKYKSSKTATSSSMYIVETAKKGNIDVTVSATGTAFASTSKDIVANNSGEIRNLTVNEGDSVAKGSSLFEVYSDQVVQQLNSANSNLKKQELQLSELESQGSNSNSTQNNQSMGNNSSKTQTQANTDNIDLQKLTVQDAETSLSNAKQQCNEMTVTAPFDGAVTVVNNANGDDIQPGKAVLTIIDPNSIRVKAEVDELDISKVKVGQTVDVTFNAIEDKTFKGTVETIGDVGNTTNNVTAYDVVVGLSDITGIKLGMTANLSINVASKSNVLLVPTEAITETNGKKYVMVETETSASASGTSQQSGSTSGSSQNSSSNSGTSQQGENWSGSSRMRRSFTNTPGRLTEIQTGLINENYAEVQEGVNEGDKLLVTLPQSSTTTTTNSRSGFGGMGGFGGMMSGGTKSRSSNN